MTLTEHEMSRKQYAEMKVAEMVGGPFASFAAYSLAIKRELEKRGPVAKAEYDAGGNCLYCGECGRCAGWHLAGAWPKSHRDSRQMELAIV